MVGHGRGRNDGGIAGQGKAMRRERLVAVPVAPAASPLHHKMPRPRCLLAIVSHHDRSKKRQWGVGDEQAGKVQPHPSSAASGPGRGPPQATNRVLELCTRRSVGGPRTHHIRGAKIARPTPPTHNPCLCPRPPWFQCLEPGSEIGLELGTGDETASNAGLRDSAASSPTTDDRELYIFHLARHALKTCRFRGREKQSPH